MFFSNDELGGTFTNDELYNNTSLNPRNTYDCSVTSGDGGNAGENATVSVANRWSGYAAPYGDVHTGVKGVAVVSGANTNVTVLSGGTYKP